MTATTARSTREVPGTLPDPSRRNVGNPTRATMPTLRMRLPALAKRQGEVAEALRDVRIAGRQHLPAHCQRLAVVLLGLFVPCALARDLPQVIEACCNVPMGRSQRAAAPDAWAELSPSDALEKMAEAAEAELTKLGYRK